MNTLLLVGAAFLLLSGSKSSSGPAPVNKTPPATTPPKSDVQVGIDLLTATINLASNILNRQGGAVSGTPPAPPNGGQDWP